MKVLVVFINIGHYHLARINSLSELGIDIEVMQLTDNPLEHPWGEIKVNNNFKIHTLYSKTDNPNVLPKINKTSLFNLLQNINPQAVFIPGWGFELSKYILEWSCNNNVRRFLMSESKYNDKKRFFFIELYKSIKYIRKFNGALVGSREHALYLKSLGMRLNVIKEGYDIVDNEYFSTLSSKIRMSPNHYFNLIPNLPKSKYFICVTRLLPRKNVINLVRAYADYHRNVTNPWDLVICGEGEQSSEIKKLILSFNLDHSIKMPGFITYQDMPIWYSFASCFVHPAISEQWGLVVNEACACKLPIICSATVGASTELLQDSKNGFLFNPLSINNLTDVLKKIHNTPEDTLYEMGNHSYKLVMHKCSKERFAKSFQSLLNL